MKIILLMLISAVMLSAGALKANSAACLNETYYDQFLSALVQKDDRMIKHLINEGKCIVTAKRLNATKIKLNWTTIILRVWIGDDSIELFTAIENYER